MNTTTSQKDLIHPIVSLVKPSHRHGFNLEQVLYILKNKKEGVTNREIAKRYFAESGIDLSIQRINQIYLRYKEGLKYV